MRKRNLIIAVFSILVLTWAAAAEAGNGLRGYSKQEGYCYVAFGRYPYDEDGGVQPILWRVLQAGDGTAYLLSEYILEVSRLHSLAFGYPGWEKADLNAWLQTDFVDRAFTAEEARALITDPELGRASLPSDEDLKNRDYGFDSDRSRRTVGTPWANGRGLFFYRNKGHSPYWTRTPSTRDFAHRSIKLEGNIGYLGVTADDMGVRPVIRLDTGAVRIQQGGGALTDPFALIPAD